MASILAKNWSFLQCWVGGSVGFVGFICLVIRWTGGLELGDWGSGAAVGFIVSSCSSCVLCCAHALSEEGGTRGSVCRSRTLFGEDTVPVFPPGSGAVLHIQKFGVLNMFDIVLSE